MEGWLLGTKGQVLWRAAAQRDRCFGELRHKGTGTLASCTLGELGGLGANPFRGGEENRAKDAKVRGMKDEEIVRG